MYANGTGVKKNEAEAGSWYRSSAENGYQDGVAALKGLAEEGSAPAQYELASMLLEGKTVPQDDKQAVELLISNWLDATLAQQELEKTMTKAQVAEAIRKAAQWQKQHPKG